MQKQRPAPTKFEQSVNVFVMSKCQWNPKYGCKVTVTACFALIALVAWKDLSDSALRKLSVHPKYKGRLKWHGFKCVSLSYLSLLWSLCLVAFFHTTLGPAPWLRIATQQRMWCGKLSFSLLPLHAKEMAISNLRIKNPRGLLR